MTDSEDNNPGTSRELFSKSIALKQTDTTESHEKSLIVIGTKGVGKTTLIHRFLEREDSAKPSIAMEYYYGRKAAKSLVKDVVHVWEVCFLHEQIILSALTGASLSNSAHNTTVLIMLDLGKPETLWNYWEECFASLSNAVNNHYKTHIMEELKARKLKSLREQAKGNDVDTITDPFPLRLCIIGARYDEFRDFEGVDKEFIGQILRAVAHVTGATLHYHSAKDSQLLRKSKELLGLYGFKGQCMKASVTDYNKPLYVPAGSDSFDAIDLKFLQDGSPVTLDTVKKAYVARFPQDWKKQESTFEDSANDPNFNEPIIDRLRLHREEEISESLRDMMEALTTNILVPDPY